MIELPNNFKLEAKVEKLKDNPFLKHEAGSYNINYNNEKIYGYRELIRVKPSVAVLITYKDWVLLSRQFRYPIYHETQDLQEAFVYETIAGIINKNIKLTVSDEIKEETGIVLTGKEFDSLYRVDNHYTSPGISQEKQTLFHVELQSKRYPSSIGLRHEGEFIYSKWLSKQEIEDLMEGVTHDGYLHRINDAKTRILIKWWLGKN